MAIYHKKDSVSTSVYNAKMLAFQQMYIAQKETHKTDRNILVEIRGSWAPIDKKETSLGICHQPIMRAIYYQLIMRAIYYQLIMGAIYYQLIISAIYY